MIIERDHNGPTYRFILYGRARSGKTCYLAALAMARKMSPKGYTCDWLNSSKHCPKPPGERADWDWHDPVVARYQGQEWLTTATDALENRATPPSNPNEAAPFRYLFEFRGPVDVPGVQGYKRTYRVEFIDYSGELIDPKVSEMQLAELVRKHLDEADGILVLAEAPRDENDRTSSFKELRKLCAAFDLIKIPKHGIPISLVFNKWDRLGPDFDPRRVNPLDPNQNTPEKREAAVIESFLCSDPEPPHLRLRSAIGDKCESGNYREFTASALGPCEPFVDQDGKMGERPQQVNPLNSYGLEDPFIWMADRSDQIHYAEVEKAASELKTWALWQFPIATLNVEKKADRVAPYVDKVPLWSQGLKRARTQARAAAAKQAGLMITIAATSIVAMLMIYLAGSDQAKFDQIDLFVGTPANFSQVAEVALGNSTKKQTDTLTNGKQFASLDEYIAQLREYDVWLAELSQGAALRSGTFATKVGAKLPMLRQNLIAELKRAESLGQYAKRLNDIESTIASSQSKVDLKDIGDRLTAIIQEPGFTNYAAQLQNRRVALENQFNRKNQDFDDRTEAGKLRSQYNGFLTANDLAGAANLLESSDNGDATRAACAELRQDLKAKAEDILKAMVMNEVTQKRYLPAATQLSTTLSSRAIEKLLGPSVVADLRGKENEWIWKPQDRDLYTRVLLDHNESSCEEYLVNSKLGDMRGVVERYRDFIVKARKPADYKLSVSEIRFGSKSWWYSDVYSYQAKAIVYAGSSQVVNTGFSSSSISAGASLTPGSPTDGSLINQGREQPVSLRVFLKVDSGRNNGGEVTSSETKVYSLSQLASGVVIPLQDTDYESGHSVKVKLSGFEEAPSLPSYGGR